MRLGLRGARAGRHRSAGRPDSPTSQVGTGGRAAWNLIDQAISSLSNAAVTVLVARTVSADEFGRFAIAFTTSILLLGFIREVVHQPFLLESSALVGGPFRRQGRAAAGAAVSLGAVLGLALLVAAAIVRGAVGASLLAAGITLPLIFLQDLLRFVGQAGGRPQDTTLNDVIWLVTLAAALGGLIAGRASSGWEYMLAWGGTAGVAAWATAGYVRLRPRLRGAVRWVWQRRDVSQWLLLELMAAYGSVQVIVLLVGVVEGPAAAGSWRGTQTLLGPVNVLGMAALSFLIPELVRRPTLSTRERLLAAAGLSGVLLAANVVWGGALLALPESVGRQVLGDTWTGARAYLPVITLWSAAVALTVGPFSLLQVLGSTRSAARVSLLLSPLLLLSAVIGLVLAGGVGAACGVALAQLVVVPMWWRVLVRVVRQQAGTPLAATGSD